MAEQEHQVYHLKPDAQVTWLNAEAAQQMRQAWKEYCGRQGVHTNGERDTSPAPRVSEVLAHEARSHDMTDEFRRILLADAIQSDNSLSVMAPLRIEWNPHQLAIRLEGVFALEDLQALVSWMIEHHSPDEPAR